MLSFGVIGRGLGMAGGGIELPTTEIFGVMPFSSSLRAVVRMVGGGAGVSSLRTGGEGLLILEASGALLVPVSGTCGTAGSGFWIAIGEGVRVRALGDGAGPSGPSPVERRALCSFWSLSSLILRTTSSSVVSAAGVAGAVWKEEVSDSTERSASGDKSARSAFAASWADVSMS